jgi:predicted RNA binding protein YcfA (HicA-like mRNA interferase family)
MGQTKEVNLFYQTKEELKILKTLGWVKIRNLS